MGKLQERKFSSKIPKLTVIHPKSIIEKATTRISARPIVTKLTDLGIFGGVEGSRHMLT